KWADWAPWPDRIIISAFMRPRRFSTPLTAMLKRPTVCTGCLTVAWKAALLSRARSTPLRTWRLTRGSCHTSVSNQICKPFRICIDGSTRFASGPLLCAPMPGASRLRVGQRSPRKARRFYSDRLRRPPGREPEGGILLYRYDFCNFAVKQNPSFPLQSPCPCGSASSYQACCGRWHHGALRLMAPDAQTLMRSRYSAFVLDERGYLLDTWHSSTRAVSLEA